MNPLFPYSSRLILASLALSGSLLFSSCAHEETTTQKRIERHIDTSDPNSGVKIGTSSYNSFAKGFEEPWPFGPYSN